MTGRRDTPHTRTRGSCAAPTGTRLVVPDLNRCTLAYWLGRALGRFAAEFVTIVAGVVSAPRKVGTTADI